MPNNNHDPASPGRTPRARPKQPPSAISLPNSSANSSEASSSRIGLRVEPATPLPGIPISPNPPSGRPRARDLLRKHYGLSAGPSTPSGNPADPMDIDSPAFDAKTYYEQMITVSSLQVLLKRDNDLVSEIKQLESDRQALVYNHHHELIAASDTIRAMKARADSLEPDLEKLKMAFSEISRLSSEVTLEVRSHSMREEQL